MKLSFKKSETPHMLRGLKKTYIYNSNNNGGGEVAGWATVVIIIVCVLLILASCLNKAKKEKAADEELAALFNQRQEIARTTFMTHTDYSKIAHSPQSGTYNYTYSMENDTPKSGKAKFTFTELDDRRGYKISGKIVNENGSSVIKEGNVCYNGKNAYWKNLMTQNGKPLAVINEGEFNFEDNTFQGRWVSNRGEQGTFSAFSLSDESAQQPLPEQSLPQEVYDLQGRPEDLIEAKVV